MTKKHLIIKGAIIEDLETNSIYEILGVAGKDRYNNYKYNIRVLYNPKHVEVTNIVISSAGQLNNVYYFNIDIDRDDDGNVVYNLGVMEELDSKMLVENETFLKSYFSIARTFDKAGVKWLTTNISFSKAIIEITREANFIEKFIFSKKFVSKKLSIERLFQEYIVVPGT